MTSSVVPLIVVLILGCFALAVLKGFIAKLPQKTERKAIEDTAPKASEEDEVSEIIPKIEFSPKEIQSQKEQSITELNETIMAAPEEAAKLITSFIRE